MIYKCNANKNLAIEVEKNKLVGMSNKGGIIFGLDMYAPWKQCKKVRFYYNRKKIDTFPIFKSCIVYNTIDQDIFDPYLAFSIFDVPEKRFSIYLVNAKGKVFVINVIEKADVVFFMKKNFNCIQKIRKVEAE